MPTALRIDSPAGPPLHAWIEAEVIRIGSGRDCDIRVEGAPASFVTIVYRQGDYYLINRMPSPLQFAGRSVSCGQEVLWPESAALPLPSGGLLTLICHHDPAPLETQPWRVMPEFDEPQRAQNAQRQWRKNASCFLVCVVTLFAVGWLQVRSPAREENAEIRAALQAFSEAMDAATNEAEQAAVREAIEWIQTAQSAERRGQVDVAQTYFFSVRDMLGERGPRGSVGAWRKPLLELVSDRLASQ